MNIHYDTQAIVHSLLALGSVVFAWAVFLRNPDAIRRRLSRTLFVGSGVSLFLELRTQLCNASLAFLYLCRHCVVCPLLPRMDKITQVADLYRHFFDRAAGAWIAFNADSLVHFRTLSARTFPSPALLVTVFFSIVLKALFRPWGFFRPPDLPEAA